MAAAKMVSFANATNNNKREEISLFTLLII